MNSKRIRSLRTLGGKRWRGSENGYRLVSRQPARSASSVEQNQRVPLAICILIWAYQRLFGV
jgi:hypothetical protein